MAAERIEGWWKGGGGRGRVGAGCLAALTYNTSFFFFFKVNYVAF